MSDIYIIPLGAGQDVGRSCILLIIGGKRIMLDCGMHMGFNDDRRFPDFSYINKNGPLTEFLDCVIISHFHLDHCGALPHMSEIVGYNGPIYMTNPTKAICPILLEDYRKITVERKGEQNFFTSDMIKACMKKVVGVNLHQVIKVDNELTIKAYYAGHVLGAAMFHIQVGNQSVVYTGDYNMTPDRHLGAAIIDKCRPDVLITESTYATTIRDSKRSREREFLKKVHSTVEKGGKVLIPVFALGRAQELCILLETYWDQRNLKVPIYFSLGLTDKATNFYKLFIAWTNEKIKNTFVQRNMFEFKHIMPFDKKLIDHPEPMVVFATPGMLHGGMSLQIFKRWCTDELNTIIVPGYCVSGTAGWKILNGQRRIEIENRQTIDVKMSVQYLSFSAHADAKGIMQLIKQCAPKNVVLVHGEAKKMESFIKNVQTEYGIPCYMPANGECINIPTSSNVPIDVSVGLLKKAFNSQDAEQSVKRSKMISGTLVMKDEEMRLLEASDMMKDCGLIGHDIRFTSSLSVKLDKFMDDSISAVHQLLTESFSEVPITIGVDGTISVSDSVIIKLPITQSKKADPELLVSWKLQDEDLGSIILRLLSSQFGK